MIGYGIDDLQLVGWLSAAVATIPLVGFAIGGIRNPVAARVAAWSLVLGSVISVERLSVSEPAGTRMLLIILPLLWSMKSVVLVETNIRRADSGGFRLPFVNWMLFAIFWFGMRPELFLNLTKKRHSDWFVFVRQGLICILLGIALCALAQTVWYGALQGWIGDETRRLLVTGMLLLGLSLMIHFGLFNVLTGAWRYRGVRVSALFRAPLLSQSLAEFWGKRWNLAFSEMTAISVFRPVKKLLAKSRFGHAVATILSFIFSGLLHELAISVPVQSGFGLPMLYFALHAIGMQLERYIHQSKFNFLAGKLAGRLWTSIWVIAPLPILFHFAFLKGCVWPILG